GARARSRARAPPYPRERARRRRRAGRWSSGGESSASVPGPASARVFGQGVAQAAAVADEIAGACLAELAAQRVDQDFDHVARDLVVEGVEMVEDLLTADH